MYFMKREMDLEARERELTALMLAVISDEDLMKNYNIIRNEIVARGFAQETVKEAFEKMSYEELRATVDAGLNEVWQRAGIAETIKDVPTKSKAAEYIEVPDGVADPFEWRERELARLSGVLEENQKKFSEKQLEEEKEKLISDVKNVLKEQGIYDLAEAAKYIHGISTKFTVRIKAVIDGKVTDKIIDEDKFNLFSTTVSESINLCFDAIEEAGKIDYPIDGVFCELGYCVEENGKISATGNLVSFCCKKEQK